jgi:hypothetical protein
MKKEVPDFIVDEETRLKKLKLELEGAFLKNSRVHYQRLFLQVFIFDLKQIG